MKYALALTCHNVSFIREEVNINEPTTQTIGRSNDGNAIVRIFPTRKELNVVTADDAAD
jgi:hypothetical protein